MTAYVNVFVRLFVDSEKLSCDVHTHLKSENMSVTVLPYADVATQLANLVGQGAGETGKIWVFCCCSVFPVFDLFPQVADVM